MPAKRKNPAAVALGKLALGKPKRITPAERKARQQRMADARAKRWPVMIYPGTCAKCGKGWGDHLTKQALRKNPRACHFAPLPGEIAEPRPA